MIVIGGQWEVMQVYRILATQFQRLTAALNAASEYTYCSMTDMTTSIG